MAFELVKYSDLAVPVDVDDVFPVEELSSAGFCRVNLPDSFFIDYVRYV